MTRAPGQRLPEALRPLFWDYEFARLSWEADRDLVIARVLASGDWAAVCWLRVQITPTALRAWIEQRRGRGLDPPRLRFWQLVLGLRRRTVDAWIADLARDSWLHRAVR